MNYKTIKKLSLSMLLSSTVSFAALAETDYVDKTSHRTSLFRGNLHTDSSWLLGIGAYSFDSLYVGGKSRTQAIPYFSYQSEHFFFDGATLGLSAKPTDNLRLSAIITSGFIGDNNRGDSSQLADMHKLKDVINGGFALDYSGNYGDINFEVVKELSNRHKGTNASFTYSLNISLGDWVFIPAIGTSWFSSDVSQYYYGVQEDEVTSSRAIYQPKSGFNYNAGLTLIRPFAEHHNIGLTFSHDKFSSEITDSPIVDRNNVNTVGLFYVYSF